MIETYLPLRAHDGRDRLYEFVTNAPNPPVVIRTWGRNAREAIRSLHRHVRWLQCTGTVEWERHD